MVCFVLFYILRFVMICLFSNKIYKISLNFFYMYTRYELNSFAMVKYHKNFNNCLFYSSHIHALFLFFFVVVILVFVLFLTENNKILLMWCSNFLFLCLYIWDFCDQANRTPLITCTKLHTQCNYCHLTSLLFCF